MCFNIEFTIKFPKCAKQMQSKRESTERRRASGISDGTNQTMFVQWAPYNRSQSHTDMLVLSAGKSNDRNLYTNKVENEILSGSHTN